MSTGAKIRAGMGAVMDATVEDERTIHNWDYVFSRPMYVPSAYTRHYVKGDCSKGCQYVCRWTPGAPDPMHNGWASWGNSNTIFVALDHADFSEAECGDIVTFGYWAGERHACMLRKKYGSGQLDWYVWNFGTDGQPTYRTLSQEIGAHAGMRFTLCKLPLPVDPPAPPVKLTHEDKLRAMKGWYAWVAWKLGEGQWHTPHNYGKANPKVRPNVPKRIPARWWLHLARYLKNRHKGNPSS